MKRKKARITHAHKNERQSHERIFSSSLNNESDRNSPWLLTAVATNEIRRIVRTLSHWCRPLFGFIYIKLSKWAWTTIEANRKALIITNW